MKVEFYSHAQLYGFAQFEDARVYFHLGVFVAGHWDGLPVPPPPILGEEVDVTCPDKASSSGRAPKATDVVRVHPPSLLQGVVESFNPANGWGFATGNNNVQYYLHRAEVEAGRLPIPGQPLTFFEGFARGRPRACHVRVG